MKLSLLTLCLGAFLAAPIDVDAKDIISENSAESDKDDPEET